MSRKRDTIDSYIDLWESLPAKGAPESPLSPTPPTPPPKDSVYFPANARDARLNVQKTAPRLPRSQPASTTNTPREDRRIYKQSASAGHSRHNSKEKEQPLAAANAPQEAPKDGGKKSQGHARKHTQDDGIRGTSAHPSRNTSRQPTPMTAEPKITILTTPAKTQRGKAGGLEIRVEDEGPQQQDPTSAPPVFDQLRAAFGGFQPSTPTISEHPELEPGSTFDDAASVYSYRTVVPERMISDRASTYTAIVNGNPFDNEPEPPLPDLPNPSPPPKDEAVTSSHDMWRHHGQPADARLSALPSHTRIREQILEAVHGHPGAAGVPLASVPQSKKKGGPKSRPPNVHIPPPPTSVRESTPRVEIDTPATTAATTMSPFSEQPVYHALTPRPAASLSPVTLIPMAATQPWVEDIEQLMISGSATPVSQKPWQLAELPAEELLPSSPARTISSQNSGSSGSSSNNSDDASSILSEKAARMLGIDHGVEVVSGAGNSTKHMRRASDEGTMRSVRTTGRSSVSSMSKNSDSLSVATSAISSDGMTEYSAEAQYRRRSDSVKYNHITMKTWDTHTSFAGSRESVSSMFSQSNATLEAACVWKALNRTKKVDSDLLTQTLVSASYHPYSMFQLRQKYAELYGTDLVDDIKRLVNEKHYRLALCRLVVGPSESEAAWLNKSDSSFFMDDKLVAEALFGRSSDELHAIQAHFERETGHTLTKALEDLYLTHSYTNGTAYDAGGQTGLFGRACIRALQTERQVETLEDIAMLPEDKLRAREASLQTYVEELYKGERPGATNKYLNQTLILELVLNKSDLYLFELCRKFYQHHGKQLTELVGVKDRSKMMVAATFPINLGYAVSYALNGAVNKPQRDAKLLEDCMSSISRHHNRLIARAIRIHYDPDPKHLAYLKDVYKQRYGKDLVARVRKDTKGAYRDLLVRIFEGRKRSSMESFI